MSETLLQKAETCLMSMRIREALTLFDEAERNRADPDACAAGRWQCHMLLGEFENAWRQSDLIARRNRPDPNRFWDGRPVDGRRVIIRCLHGLGDTIQFVRYIPLVRERAKSVNVEAQPKLKVLLNDSGLGDQVITWSDPQPEWDQQIEIIELPRVFRTTLSTIPCSVPYVRAQPCRIPLASSGELKVGLVWCSSAFNPARSIAMEDISRLSSVPGVAFYALQSGPEHDDTVHWPGNIVDLHREIATIHDTASIVTALDLIITVDTMTAHLAGALGVPVWTLLPFECDWRWMLHREDSPWYPSMCLFRQPAPGDWASVIRQVEQRLLQVATRPPVTQKAVGHNAMLLQES
jgi:hypothetical protein